MHDNLAQTGTVVVKDGQLSVINAQKKDSGLYKCKATNPLGEDSAVTQLVVVEVPHFTVRPPSQLEVETIQNVTVRCQATGDPQPKVTWTKESGELPVRRSEVGVDGTLKIWNPVEEDSGIYTCVASSKVFFKAFSVMKLTVTKGKEEFTSKKSGTLNSYGDDGNKNTFNYQNAGSARARVINFGALLCRPRKTTT